MQDRPIYDLLKRDHETVSELLHKAREAKGDEARELLVEITRELNAHARAEEAVLYAHLLHNERTRAKILEALEEHKQVDVLLADLARLPPRDERFVAKLDVVADNVGHHVDEEEGELFPLARQILGEKESVEFGRRFLAERERIMRDMSGLVAEDAAE
mgnify:CR=1 FL=1